MGIDELRDRGSFTQREPMNFRAEPGKDLFEPGQRCRNDFRRNLCQARGPERAATDFVEIRRMIGRDIEDPAWNQSTRHSRQKALTDHASRSVPPLRPWIGKHQVKSRDGSRRQQLSNHIRDLESEGPSILQASLLELARSTSDAAIRSLSPSTNGCGWTPTCASIHRWHGCRSN